MNSAPPPNNSPNTEEINTLGSLFAQGRFPEAATFAHSLTVRYPLNQIGWTTLGVAFSQMGRMADALLPMQKAAELFPEDADAHSNLGYAQHALGLGADAETSCRRAIQIRPDFAEAHNNLGNTLFDCGRLEEAEKSYLRSLSIKLGFAEAHNNLGNVLRDLGRPDEAEESYRRALQIKPDFTEVHGNLGNILRDLGRFEEAEKSYKAALQINPDFAEAHCNLGNLFRALDRQKEAEVCCRRALQLKPDNVDALNCLALLLNEQDEPMKALDTIKQSLQVKETVEAKNIFLGCIKRLHFVKDNNEIRSLMVSALNEPWGRPNDLSRAGIELIKLNSDIGACVNRAVKAWPVRLSAQDLYAENGIKTFAADLLLNTLLISAPVSDVEMERFLTMSRCTLLEAANKMTESDDEVTTALGFYSALTRQCFINEYVFANTDDEIKIASELRVLLITALNDNTPIQELCLLTVGAYFPLCGLPSASRLLNRKWSSEVQSVLVQQVSEPEEELKIRATIPCITPIEGDISLRVQRQYEENPYPRWVKAAHAGKAKSIDGYLHQKFPLTSFKRYGKVGKIDVLVAGCGTGQHSISTAQQFQGAHVLSVDLSISSLSYAKRKADEMKLTTIEFAQADLLKLRLLGRSFDVIESAGVLHHLEDPWTGWRTLLSLLKPNGLMRLGFYSAKARRNIVAVRAFIAENNYGDSPAEIRKCRQALLDAEQDADFGDTLKSADFFSISECRDLLFHVQEHCMTLTDIDVFLRENNLVFLGFDISSDVLQSYRHRFPEDKAAINLGKWQIFENENPDTFIGMYQFLAQKSG